MFEPMHRLLFPLVLTAGLAFTSTSTNGESDSPTMAEQYPPRVDELRPTSGYAPRFHRPVEAVDSERVPLMIDWGDNEIPRSQTTFGLPFARGALPDLNRVRLVNEDGEVVPAGFHTTATWDGPDGPVRWALVHANLEEQHEYFIEFGTEVEAGPAEGIQITETDEAIVIQTGPMRASVSREIPSLVASVSLTDEEDDALVLSAESARNLPFVLDAEGNLYSASADEDFSVEVLETGPQRAAIRREGWYVDDNGDRFCQFITYTYFYAGQTGFRHDHTLVVAFDTNAHQIRDIQLPVPLNLDGETEAWFATDVSPDGSVIALPGGEGPYRLVQSAHDHWELTGPHGQIEAGSRAGGWYGLGDGTRGAMAGLTHFWENFPAELETDGNILRVHLWPARGVAPLDFRPSSEWQLGDEYPGDHVFHNVWYRDGLDEMTQGYGVGKTHTLYLEFFDGDGREAAWRQTRAKTVEPVLALPDPEYVCATEAFFGRLHPYDPDQFPEIEALIDYVVATYLSQRENNEQYGWIHFGDIYNTGSLWRRWGSMFYGFPNVMPRLYLRSGRRDAWEFHRVNTRHVTDIDICHLDSEDLGIGARHGHGKVKGKRYGGDGGIAHYAGDLYVTGPDHHLEFMLLDYYLNGNLRTWEVANDYLQAHVPERETNSSMLEYQHRGTGGALRLFTEGYWATWDPEYLSIMRQCADILYRHQEEAGGTRRDDVYMNPGKILYYQITGEERMRDLFLNDMNLLSEERDLHGSSSGGRGATLSGLAHAYWFTGDERYLPFLNWQLEELAEKGIGGLRGNFLARHATHGYQLPQILVLLDEVDELPPAEGPAPPDLSEPAPFAVKGNGPAFLLQEKDEDFTVTVDVNLYRRHAGNFHNWADWIKQLDEDEAPRLLVIDPDGEEIKNIALTVENTADPITIEIEADGKTGAYVVTPANWVAPVEWHLRDSTLAPHVFQTGETYVSGGISRRLRQRTLWFKVPAGTEEFVLELKAGMLRGTFHYAIHDDQGNLVQEESWAVGASPRDEWEVIELDAGGPDEDTAWSISLHGVPDLYLRFDGIPGFVASTPEALFTPDADLVQPGPEIAEPAGEEKVNIVATDLPWGGKAAYLASRLVVEDDEKRPLLEEDSGTIELWVKTIDAPSNLRNRNLISCGSLGLSRRINIGTYGSIDGQAFHRFFILPNNRWTHLAFTWQPSDEEGADTEIRLFADGVEVKDTAISGSGTPHRQVSPGWAGTSLELPGDLFVSNVRLSDSVRYQENFARPDGPFEPDPETLVLIPFDGSGEMSIFGETVPLP